MSEPNGEIKILIYGEYFLPVIGGVQTAMNLLAKGLVEMNPPLQNIAGVGKISVTIATRTPTSGLDDSMLSYRVVRQPRLRQLIRLIRKSDVVHIAGPCLLPMMIAWLLRKPAVVEHHGYQAICPNGLLFRLPAETVCPGYFGQRKYGKCVRCVSRTAGTLGAIRMLALTFPRRWLCKKVSANITITNHVAKRLKFPRMQTVYYGIEEPDLANIGEPALSGKQLEIAYVGRLVPEKGLQVLLHAAEILKKEGVSFKLLFIGGGPEQGKLERLAEGLGIREYVHFTGDLRESDLDRAVSQVAIVVMPSIWEETAGLSAIEQMMRGRVVVAADIGGLSEVVGDAGLKFPPGDSLALAACIKSVIDAPSMALSLGAEARERALQFFRIHSMIRNHLSVFRVAASR